MDWLFYMIKSSTVCGLILGALFVHAEDLGFEKAKIRLEKKTLTVELAKTPDQWQRGLMFRTKLEKDSGMLFVFERAELLSFWMKNTKMDLSIGFFDEGMKLINVEEMAHPKSVLILDEQLPKYSSARPAKYALEMAKGWFSNNNIKPGARFEWVTSTPPDLGRGQRR
jgi:uncharacterized membrane protein (UPF0127 family)